MTRSVSVVFITHRSDASLLAAIRSVVAQDHRPLEIVLYGNGAPVDVPALSTSLQDVRLTQGWSPVNLGVAGGRNAAAALATGEYLLFLDDDAVLRPGAISAAVEAVEADPGIGAVAFRVAEPHTGRTVVWFYREDPSVWGERAFDVPSVVGGGNLLRRDAFEQLGGFWDGYFREMEEIDFSWRLWDAGWRIRYEPRACFEHADRTARLYRYAVPSNIHMLWRLLPYGLALRQTLVKLPLFAARAVRHREAREFLAGVRHLVAAAPRVAREREALSPPTVERLRRWYGRGGVGARLQWAGWR